MDKYKKFLFPLLLLGILLRFYHLGYNDLWFDEVQSLRASFNLTPHIIIQERQAPLYYFLLRRWIVIFKPREFTLRLFSAIFSILSIFVIYLITIYVFDKNTALFSALILSISPFHIWYSQEVRKYAFFTFIVLGNNYYFLKGIKENKNIFWLIYIFFLIIGFYTDYFVFFLIIAQGLFILYLSPIRLQLKKWLFSVLVSSVIFSSWIPVLIKQFQGVAQSFWIIKPVLKDVIITLENFNLGFNASLYSYKLSHLFFVPLFIIGLFQGFKNTRFSCLFCLSLFLPLGISFLISKFIVPIYLDRLFVAFSVFYYIFLGYGINTLKPQVRVMSMIPIMLLIFLSLNNYYRNYMPADLSHHKGTYVKKPVKPVVEFLISNSQEEDLFVFTHPLTFVLVEGYAQFFYNFKFRNLYYFIFPQKQDAYWKHIIMDLSTVKYYLNLETEHAQLKFNRIWLISSSWPRDGTLDENSIAVREWLEKNYKRVFEKWFDGILVGLYEKK